MENSLDVLVVCTCRLYVDGWCMGTLVELEL